MYRQTLIDKYTVLTCNRITMTLRYAMSVHRNAGPRFAIMLFAPAYLWIQNCAATEGMGEMCDNPASSAALAGCAAHAIQEAGIHTYICASTHLLYLLSTRLAASRNHISKCHHIEDISVHTNAWLWNAGKKAKNSAFWKAVGVAPAQTHMWRFTPLSRAQSQYTVQRASLEVT